MSDRTIPELTTAQMIEVDRAMIEDLGIELIQMMENAGRCLAELARRRFLNGDPRGRRILVLAGSGGNGGGALVAARRLSAWGASVRIVTTRPAREFRGVPSTQLGIARRIGLAVSDTLRSDSAGIDLVIDGIIGYSLTGPPRGAAAGLIGFANDCGAPILSLDVPSGVDSTSGQAYEPAVRATATLTLALPKTGLARAAENVGELWLGDIGVPPALYSTPSLGLDVGPIFFNGDLLRLR